ncbi:ABC transporter transmembrane region 2-domain-containing protein [Favolaschia claudopus]|uniref:ABC transporter transmembrane region 2-domain-containing protein n=1 Tax=Favolaschia claudopus TaxID=2862362 RepID=A0AAW0BR46_9AGAR
MPDMDMAFRMKLCKIRVSFRCQVPDQNPPNAPSRTRHGFQRISEQRIWGIMRRLMYLNVVSRCDAINNILFSRHHHLRPQSRSHSRHPPDSALGISSNFPSKSDTSLDATQNNTKRMAQTWSWKNGSKAILFRIAFPAFWSKETLIVVSHSFFLILRTVLSIAVARLNQQTHGCSLDGRIVWDLVRADGKGFLKGLGLWFLLAIPSSYTNSMVWPVLMLDLKMTLSCGNILKPSLDLVLFTSQLAKSLGVRGTILLFGNYYLTVTILRAVTPAFGRLAAVEAKLEGEYRAGMGRIGREGEEIAFYDGGTRERDILSSAYLRLIKHVNNIYKIRIAYEWTEDYVIKYLWSAAGYGLIAVALLFTRRRRSVAVQAGESDRTSGEKPDDAVAGRTETYISNRRLLISLADAGGRLMYAYKDLLELAGLTTRIYTLLSTLHNLPRLPSSEADVDSMSLANVNVGVPQGGALQEIELDDSLSEELQPARSAVLVSDLSFVVKDGEHLMITGSNGVGKTAVARVLAGLWAPHEPGQETRVQRPKDAAGRPSVFVVPQRAYMVTGSSEDQHKRIFAEFHDQRRREEGYLAHEISRSGKGDVPVPVIFNSVFTSGVILLLNFWSGKRTGLPPRLNSAISEVQKCMAALHSSSDGVLR